MNIEQDVLFLHPLVCRMSRAVDPGVMDSLTQEIQGFSRRHLKKQCTRVTTVTGRKLLETRDEGEEGEEHVEVLEEGGGCGFVEDKSLDLQVGVVRPFLLLGNIHHFYYYCLYYDCFYMQRWAVAYLSMNAYLYLTCIQYNLIPLRLP